MLEYPEIMIKFDPSEIDHWASQPEAPHRLPELIRRLTLATVPIPSLLHMPSGSSVWRPGWDGRLVVENGNTWVSDGASAWEFSCAGDPKRKATADYNKRTTDPNGVETSTTAFVFVTLRKWDGKLAWANERREKGPWSDVRVLDADDLVLWLEQAPTVALWFARLIGKLPATGVVPLDEWWESWSTVADPQVSPQLITAGRQDQAEMVAQWLRAEPSHYYVQGDTQDEAIAFLAGCVRADESQLGSAILAKAVVVESADAWRSLEGHPSPLVLVRNFSGGNVSPKIAVGRGHHVLTPLGEHDDSSGAGVTLPRLGREETLQELIEMGHSEAKARTLVRRTARRLSVMHRRLVDEAGEPPPDWASPSTPHSLVALALVGQWDGDHEGDTAIVAEIVGQSYDEVERELADLMAVPDSPLTKVGNRWRLTSHEEAWHLLAPRLTSSDVDRFERVATSVFGVVSPEFELPVEDRYMANIYGKVLPHSGTLREGMARSLALMATQAERANNVEAAPYVPARVVSAALGDGKGWQTWATLSGSLAELAEAAPEALLDVVERDLDADPSPFGDLFAQEEDALFAGTPHTGLLWALELLAWSPDHFARAAKCLARLAEIDPGGQVANRPAASLLSLFLPWIRFSEASDEHRLETLKMLMDTVPSEGWRLLLGACSSDGGVTVRQPPSWRPWAQDGTPKPTVGEYQHISGQMTKMLLNGVGTDADRWADLVGIVPSFSPEDRGKAIALLSRQTKALRQHRSAHGLWVKLRELLHRHRSHPDAAWAMAAEELSVLEAVYQELTPADPVAAHARLFDNWPDLPEGKPRDYEEARERIAEARREAIRTAHERGGVPAILAIAEAAQEPHEVGVAVARSIGPELALDLAMNYLGSTSPKLRNMAYGGLRALFLQSGWQTLDEAIATAKASGPTPQVLADIYLVAPAVRGTWNRLDEESEEVRTAYWETIGGFSTEEWDAEDLDFAVRQLLSAGRSAVAVQMLVFESVPYELVIQILEALPVDLAASADQGPYVEAYYVAEFFKKLDRSDDVPDDVIFRLEIPYLDILARDRPQLALHRLVVSDPSLFADVVTWAFKRADGEAEEPVDDEVLKHRASVAYSALHRLRLLPGPMEDGSVDVEALSNWVNEARRMCRERDRKNIGGQQIGQVLANAPVGEDGIWPCEPVRDLLDDLGSHHIGLGFTTGKRNLRGITSRGVFDGGEQERSLADGYRQDAEKTSARWPFTAKLLRELAASYESQARQEDQEADWSDQFES